MNHIFFQSLRSNVKKNWMFYLVLLFTLVIRIFQLTQYPPILNRDEAALAYNAKLLVESGKDEWGITYPLQFKSFGDYKLPGYIYTLVPLFQIFGTNDFIVRLPSVLAGVGIVIVGALLVNKLFDPQERKYTNVISMIAFAITPVFFFYSRMAWEANVALFFFLSAIYVFVRNKKSSIMGDLFSGVLLLLAILTYNTPLLLLPFMLPVLITYRGVTKVKKWILPFVVWTFVLFFGLFMLLSVAAQKSGITIFTDETITLQYPIFRQQFPSLLQTILGNKYVYWLSIILKNYVATFSPDFLVAHGGSHPWHSILGRGHIYLIEFVGFLIGVITLANRSVQSVLRKKWSQFIRSFTPIYLLLISPLPAVITVDAPHSTRSLFTFFMIVGFSVNGILNIFTFTFVRRYSTLLSIMLVSWMFVETIIYGYQYFVEWSKNYPEQLNVGYDQLVRLAESNYPNQNKVVIDDEGYLYVLMAWYANMDANTFLDTVQKHLPDKIGLQYGYKVGNYRFVKYVNDRVEGEDIVLMKKDNEWGIETVQ